MLFSLEMVVLCFSRSLAAINSASGEAAASFPLEGSLFMVFRFCNLRFSNGLYFRVGSRGVKLIKSLADSTAAGLSAEGEPFIGVRILFVTSGGVSTVADMLVMTLTGVAGWLGSVACTFTFKSCRSFSSFMPELLRRTGLTRGTRLWGVLISFSEIGAFPLA